MFNLCTVCSLERQFAQLHGQSDRSKTLGMVRVPIPGTATGN